jgi:hypothetical protein
MDLFHFTARSSNKKTGPIAVTTSSENTCSPSCIFSAANGGGCYASTGPLKLHWDRVSRGERGGDFLHLQDSIGAAKLPAGSLMRWNQAGDLPHLRGELNWPLIQRLQTIFSAAKLRVFTYTHHLQTDFNLMVVRSCNASGFTVNLSCDSETQAARRHREGYPSVCVVPKDDTRKSWELDGVKFQTCPAQLKDGVTCATCQLCTLADRACVVAFRAHGTGARKVSERIGA